MKGGRGGRGWGAYRGLMACIWDDHVACWQWMHHELFCVCRFPEPNGVFFVSENWSSWKRFCGPLEWQGTGSKTLCSSQLDRVWSVLKANPKLMQDQGRVLVLKVGCYLATSSKTGVWVGLNWLMKCSQGGLSPKVKAVYHMEVTSYMRFAFGVRMCAYICIYALHTAISNCGNCTCAHLHINRNQ